MCSLLILRSVAPQKTHARRLVCVVVAANDQQPTQPTRPLGKDERGQPYAPAQIPVPSREAVFSDLAKVVPPAPPPKPKRKSKRRKSG
jgi:hypothetical protein